MTEHRRDDSSQDLALLFILSLAGVAAWRLWQSRIGPAVTGWVEVHGVTGALADAGRVDLALLTAGVLVLLASVCRRRSLRSHQGAKPSTDRLR